MAAKTCDPACGPGLECRAGECVCSASSCPGCCLSGACVAGDSAQACGLGGAACATCGGLTPACVAGVCSGNCSDQSGCGSGCCAAESCLPGDQAAACGIGGACKSCVDNAEGGRCINGACGCLGPEDCPPSFACNAGHCRADGCGPSAPCNGGCCDDTGVCRAGDDAAACGAQGQACVTCATTADGAICLPSAKCGCAIAADCASTPQGHVCGADGICACNTLSDCPPAHDCVQRDGRGACQPRPCDGLTATCPGTCCTSQSLCAGAQTDGACGTSGGLCLDCGASSDGPRCLAGVCGCNNAAECSVGQACYNHVCSDTCDPGAGAGCNQTCCDTSSGVPGTCVAGLANGACGATGLCVSCPAGTTCDDGARACLAGDCFDAMVEAPGGDFDPCVGGCCSGGVCTSGGNNGACGATGGMCVACSGNETCSAAHVCSASGCDATHLCVGSNSCCDAGNVCTTANGTCNCNATADCAANVDGHVCVLGDFPNHCGCAGAADCPAGSVCSLATHRCVAGGACGGAAPCNGCCSGGNCVDGLAANACGSGGGICANCQIGSNNMGCVDGNTCGCLVATDCARGRVCLPTQQCTTSASTCEAGDCNGCCSTATGTGNCLNGTSQTVCGSNEERCENCVMSSTTCDATDHFCL